MGSRKLSLSMVRRPLQSERGLHVPCDQPSLPPPAPFGSPLELIDVLNLPRLKPFKTLQASGYDRDGGPPSEYHGTGTEDYLNFAWGLGHRGAFPLHGLNAGSTASGGHVNGYRLGLADVVPFEGSIRFTIEHGHGNEDRGRYRGVVFWYQQYPRAVW